MSKKLFQPTLQYRSQIISQHSHHKMLPKRISEVFRRATLLWTHSPSSLFARSTSALLSPPLACKTGSSSRDSGSWSSFSSLWIGAPLAMGSALFLSGPTPAWAEVEPHADVASDDGGGLISLKTRQRLFFAYEKRIRYHTWQDQPCRHGVRVASTKSSYHIMTMHTFF